MEGVSAERGFTLLEVLVAMTILALSLTAIMELFSGAVRAASVSRDYAYGTYLGRQALEDFLLAPAAYPENHEVIVEPYTITVNSEPFVDDTLFTGTNEYQVYRVTAQVSWSAVRGKRKTITLESLRVAKKEENEK